MKCPASLYFNEEKKVCDFTASSSCMNEAVDENRIKISLNRKPLKKPIMKNDDDDDQEEFICPARSGLFANPNDCTAFYNCFEDIPYAQRCPVTLFWNDKKKICDGNNECLKKRAIKRIPLRS